MATHNRTTNSAKNSSEEPRSFSNTMTSSGVNTVEIDSSRLKWETDSIRPLIAINKELSVQFVLGYSVKEFEESLTMIADGSFDVADLISHQIGLEEVSDTFEALKSPESHAKVIVNPTH